MSRPLAIAFLACNKNPTRFREDPSFTYRCENLGLALAAQGHQVTWSHLTAPGWTRRPDVVVFHRPLLSWTLAWWWLRLRRQGVRLVADVDDLVFDPALAAHSPAVLNGQLPIQALRRRFWRHREALRHFDLITASTEPLAAAAARLPRRPAGAKVHWLPNAVYRGWRTLPAEPATDPLAPVLRYLPGTPSHDRDFALIAPVLTEVLRVRPQARLEVVGPLAFALDLPARQIQHQARRPFADYHQVVRAPGINLAPLEATPFTACKSALKVIESAFWQVPTVCSPLQDALRFVGAGACVAETPADWTRWLSLLLDDGPTRLHLTASLRERVLALADIDQLASDWCETVRAWPVPGRRRA
ncbi:hypothetical protein KGA65_01785 [Ideonella sp. B7]|uniref:hypothetical protein n=1 Tax=Ideonella benzenivorans TaxID=2831643 RepID=UPI001CED9BCB|nr:hypothetical protein [Ideonella benzenivorans]MCA6215262.1 hypothetical protein [Ideonella benzenivorans]